MGLFSKVEPVVVEGVIARIGIVSHNEASLVYGVHLVGRKERFWVDANVGAPIGIRTNDHVTMAARGDRVRFGTNPKKPHQAMRFFDNETVKADLGR
jgi:hypothetical protein